MVDINEVAKHNSKKDCWLIIHNHVYDISEYLPEHPGGEWILLMYAGRDATKKFDSVHTQDILEVLPKSKHLGPVTGEVDTTARSSRRRLLCPFSLRKVFP
jgi:L-lactate dehydrogenase (cytochrome)